MLSGMPADEIQQRIHALPKQELPLLMFKPIDTEQLAQVLELKLSGELPDTLEAEDGADEQR